jgi:8-oxo-dGTP diphosphatase
MKTEDNAHFHIVLVKAWIENNGRFLLAQRAPSELHVPGAWSLPGGKIVDRLEPQILENTLKEEVREEVGIEIDDRMELIYNNSFRRVDGAHVVGLTFLCKLQSGDARALEDTVAVQWLTVEELKKFKDTQDFLKNEIKELVRYLETRRG